jgi:hypothetical protein
MTTNRRRLSRDIAGSGSTRTPAPLPAVDFKPLRRTPDQTPSGRRR